MLSVWTNCFARRRGIRLKCGQGAGHLPRPHHPVVPRMLMTCVCRPAFDVLLTTGTEVAFSSIVQCTILCPQVIIIVLELCTWCVTFSGPYHYPDVKMFYCLWQQTTLSCHVIKFTDWKGSSAGSMWRGSAWSLMSLVFSNFDIDLFAPSLVESAYQCFHAEDAIVNLVSPPEICP